HGTAGASRWSALTPQRRPHPTGLTCSSLSLIALLSPKPQRPIPRCSRRSSHWPQRVGLPATRLTFWPVWATNSSSSNTLETPVTETHRPPQPTLRRSHAPTLQLTAP